MARTYPRYNGGPRSTILPIDLMIHVFVHLRLDPADLLHCALTTSLWVKAALQELYRHPWMYLFTYQFEAEGRVMDKTASALLLRTLFSSCLDPPRTLFPYASFARSINLKWVNDTFDLPEADIQTLTGLRWTRNETPKDFFIRSLIASRPYLSDFVHCQTSRTPRCQHNQHAHNHHLHSNQQQQQQQQESEQGQPALPQHILPALPSIVTVGTSLLTALAPIARPPMLLWDSTTAQWIEEALPNTDSEALASGSVMNSPVMVTPVEDASHNSPTQAQLVALFESSPSISDSEPFSPSHTSGVSFSLSSGSSSLSASTSSDLTSAPGSLPSSASLWPLSLAQTQELTFLDLRFAAVTDQLILSLAQVCCHIESFKVANHWQHYQSTYSITDRALSYFVAAQQSLKLVHIENRREISHDHELVEMIRALAVHQGSTLETLVLKTHDFQNCDLGLLGTACRCLKKFAAPGGMHLMRDQVLRLTEACKSTLEHLDFSSSDIETSTLMSILKGIGGASVRNGINIGDDGQQTQSQSSSQQMIAAKGKLKALVLMGMEDTLNHETCTAIGDYASGLECFRLDILESEARDVALMLAKGCGRNLRVLTLGCHDVNGDLANEILEQIATHCRLLEILDVNHWTFSNNALEKVLRKCRLLRYLNVSYTSIDEQAVEVICECLGEVKMPADPTADQPGPTIIFEDDDEEMASVEEQDSVENKGKAKERAVADDAAQSDQLLEPQPGPNTNIGEVLTEQEQANEKEREAWLRWYSQESEMMPDDEDQQKELANASSCPSSSSVSHSQANKADSHDNDEDELEFDMEIEMDEATGMDLDMSLDMHRYCSNKLRVGKQQQEQNDASSMLDEDDSMSEAEDDSDDDVDDDSDDIDSTVAIFGGFLPVSIQRDVKGKGISIDSSGGSYNHQYSKHPFFGTGPSFSSSSALSSSAVSSPESSAASSSSSSSGSSAASYATASSSTSFSSTSSATGKGIVSCVEYVVSGLDQDKENQRPSNMLANTMQSAADTTSSQGIPLLPSLPIPCCHHTNNSHPVSTADIEAADIQTIIGSAIDKVRETICDPSTSDGGKVENLTKKDGSNLVRGPFYSRLEQVNIECCSNVSVASEVKIKALMAMKQEAFRDPTRSYWARTWVSTSPASSLASPPTPYSSAAASSQSSSLSSTSNNTFTMSESEDIPPVEAVPTTAASVGFADNSNSSTIASSDDGEGATTSYTITTTITTTTSFVMQGHKMTRIWAENEHDMMMTRLALERDGLLEAIVKWEHARDDVVAAAASAQREAEDTVVASASMLTPETATSTITTTTTTAPAQEYQAPSTESEISLDPSAISTAAP